MRTVTRAVRAGALQRSEVPADLWPELDERLAKPADRPLTVYSRRDVWFGVGAVVSGLAWAGFLVWVSVTEGVPRKVGGNIAVIAILVIGGLEAAWAARHWRTERAQVINHLREDALSALQELCR